MKRGEPIPSHYSYTDIYLNCRESLKRLHVQGYCHTDIRLPNILKFGDKLELIDFGECQHGQRNAD